VADRDPAAPGFALADRRCIVSTEDEPALTRLAQALDLDGILAPGTDWPVAVAARVAEKAGLPHPVTPRSAVLATNKLRQRERLAEAGVPQPRWQVVTDGPVELEPPVVVKAPDRQGQKGLALVRKRNRLAAAVEAARGASRGGAALVEELVEGPEVTINAVSVEGTFVPLAVTDRVTAAQPAHGVALAHVWPCTAALEPVIETARLAAAAVGLRDGPSYTQVRVGSDGPKVMELAARLGGGHDAELVEAATGVPLNNLAIEFALGRTPTLPEVRTQVGGACVVFLVAPVGELRAVDGVAEATAVDGVSWARVYRRPGWRFGPLLRGADRAGAVLATGTSREDALERARRAAEAVRFQVDADAA
jgi:biotin carboxylase